MPRRTARTDAAGERDLALADRITLRPAEAAEVLGVSERTLRTFLPRLPHFREGNVVLIPVDELRRWARERAKTQRAAEGEVVDRLIEKISQT